MLISDLIEDLNRHSEEEVEFHLIDKGITKKLDLYILDGRYLFKVKRDNPAELDFLLLGLVVTEDAKAE